MNAVGKYYMIPKQIKFFYAYPKSIANSFNFTEMNFEKKKIFFIKGKTVTIIGNQ